MIWQLMKRDFAWQATPWMVAIFAIFGHKGWTLELFPILVIPSWIFTYVYFRFTVYEAALPVKGSELWLSRVVSRLALLWLPLLASAAITFVIPGGNLRPLFEASAVWTVILLGLIQAQMREFIREPWLLIACAGLMAASVGFVPLLTSTLGSSLPPEGAVLAVCGVATAALFAWGWATAPDAFQVAPVKAGEGVEQRDTGRSPSQQARLKWSPVFTSIHVRTPILPMVVASLVAFGQIGLGMVYLPIYFNAARRETGWLCMVPFSQRQLFRLMIAPMAGAFVLGSAIRFALRSYHPLSVRAWLVETAGELTVLFINTSLWELVEWRRLSGVRKWIRYVPAVAFLAAAMPPAAFLTDYWIFDRASSSLAQLLPQDWLIFSLALVAPVAMAYSIAERISGELEYVGYSGTMRARMGR